MSWHVLQRAVSDRYGEAAVPRVQALHRHHERKIKKERGMLTPIPEHQRAQ